MQTSFKSLSAGRKSVTSCKSRKNAVSVRAAKELHFNTNMEALKKMQAGADKLATVVGVTIGPKVRRLRYYPIPSISNYLFDLNLPCRVVTLCWSPSTDLPRS
jgi:hypothetical protein